MANLSKERRDRMMEKLEELKTLHSDDESIMALNEIENALKEKKFGLVFEEHSEEVDEMLINNIPVLTADPERRLCKDESLPWNFIIEGDNLQALYLLEKTHRGKVDCIYIDPPYNSGATDWKYNNDYVDNSDAYRHSKWLSMMKTRLLIAKCLLNPESSVLIVTIDEKEYLHLGCLLEELFPEARIQMVSSVVNPKGSARDGFSRCDEYLFFVMIGECIPMRLPLTNEWAASAVVSATISAEKIFDQEKLVEPGWTSMMRRGTGSLRTEVPTLYYPIYVNPITKKIDRIGTMIPMGQDRAEDYDGLVQVLPYRTNGEQGRWQVGPLELQSRIKQGRIRLGRETSYGYVINYLPDGQYNEILNGVYEIQGYADDGSIIAYKANSNAEKLRMPPTQWKIASHNASENGTAIINSILGMKKFSFPKSLYAVRDTLKFFVTNKPNAVVIDFFAGSGTTMHALNLLNAEDGGNRRCILVTNNEISEAEEKDFEKRGVIKGSEEWEAKGIARFVTWPRTICSINGVDINGKPLKGNYLGIERPMSQGFDANVKFFKCDWVSRNPEDDNLTELLFEHIKEMVELENHIEVDNKNYAIVLDEETADFIENNWNDYCDLKGIYLSRNVLLTTSQNELFYTKPVNIIPDCYFNIEMREVGESW